MEDPIPQSNKDRKPTMIVANAPAKKRQYFPEQFPKAWNNIGTNNTHPKDNQVCNERGIYGIYILVWKSRSICLVWMRRRPVINHVTGISRNKHKQNPPVSHEGRTCSSSFRNNLRKTYESFSIIMLRCYLISFFCLALFSSSWIHSDFCNVH